MKLSRLPQTFATADNIFLPSDVFIKKYLLNVLQCDKIQIQIIKTTTHPNTLDQRPWVRSFSERRNDSSAAFPFYGNAHKTGGRKIKLAPARAVVVYLIGFILRESVPQHRHQLRHSSF